MPRTTAAAVREIKAVDASVASLDPFITAANLLVTRACGSVEGMTEEMLTEIERWLAAHFASILDPQVASEAAGPVSASYQYSLGKNLGSTMYGAQALALDWSGNLAAISKRAETGKPQRVSVLFVGTVPDTVQYP